MARRAGYVLGSRQQRVPEQQPAQLNFFWGRRVISRRLLSQRQRRHTVFTVDRELSFLSNGTNFQEKEYGDRSCCDQQSCKVFRSEQKLTELAFRHCCLLAHALLRFLALPQNLWTPIGTNGPRHAVLAPDLDIFRHSGSWDRSDGHFAGPGSGPLQAGLSKLPDPWTQRARPIISHVCAKPGVHALSISTPTTTDTNISFICDV